MKIDLAAVQAIDKIEDREEKVYRAALLYADQKIAIIPIPYGEKHVNSQSLYTSRCSARREKIIEWFNPETGIYKGYNIAIGCGDYYGNGGVFAVDVDTKYLDKYKDQVWGPAAWEALEDQHGEITAPIQRTPSGGTHILMEWEDNLTPSQNRLAPAIDTRGGHPGKISSHIMAWPSVVGGTEYNWEAGGEIPKAPSWITDAMGVAWNRDQAKAGPGRGNEAVKDEDVERQVSLDQTAELLSSLSPDDLDYAEWVKVGQAIHSQHTGNDGLELWDLWSQQGARYEQGECAVRWRGFKANGPVRMATLFYYVQQYGEPSKVTSEAGGSEDNFVADSVDEYNRKYGLTLVGENAKIIRKERVLGSIQYKYKLYSIDAFRAYCSNDVIVGPDANGKEKAIRKLDIWMSSPRRNTFDGMVMKPDLEPVIKDDMGMRWLNTWAGFAVKSNPDGSWELLKRHIMENLCSNNQEYYDWLMDWMADMIQDPANPKGTAVILGGIEGAGKGTLANALAHLFGVHASVISNAKHLTSQYNDMIMDSVFLFADEVVYAGNHEVGNQLKAMVTEKNQTREQKFGAKEKVESYLHIMMSTNNEWKIAAGPESRRYFVLQVQQGIANDRAYFGAIRDELHNGGYGAMLYELQKRVIIANLRYAPVTQELKNQRNLMQVQSLYDSLPAWLAHILTTEQIGCRGLDEDMESEGSGWPTLIQKAGLWEEYADWSRKYKSKVPILAATVFYPKLVELGFVEGPRKILKSGRVRTLIIPAWEDAVAKAKAVYAINIQGDSDE